MSRRTERLAEEIREEVARIVGRELKDPRIGFVTITWVELTAEAVTFWPPAVIAAIAPKVWFEWPVWELSDQDCARLAIAPEAEALGIRPLHRFTLAVIREPAFAPVTSAISSSLPAGTQAVRLIPPPDSCSTPLYRSR